MKAFLLNSTTIIENNAKIYVYIIMGLVGCLILLVAEAVHVQNLVQTLQNQENVSVRAAIDPLIDRYRWSRYFILVLSVIGSVYQYKKTKKKLGL